MNCANLKASSTLKPNNQANGNMITPKIFSSVNQCNPVKLNSWLIRAANETKAITVAVIIKINLPAPRIESPKNEKNGSFLVPFSWIVTMTSSFEATLLGFKMEVMIMAPKM